MVSICLYPAIFSLVLRETMAQSVESEESVFADFLRNAAVECASHISAPTVSMKLTPDNSHPIIRQIFSEVLLARNVTIVGNQEAANATISLDIRGMNASTVSIDKSSYLRKVSMRFGAVVEEQANGRIVFSKEFTPVRIDTIAGTLQYVEKDFTLPEKSSWLENIVAPILVTATALVVVVLFFTVRGS